MRVILQRAWEDSRATMGMLKVLDSLHDPIYTLENPLRGTSVDSRIPAGSYICKPVSTPKFEDVYLVTNVPGRTGILFHWGNTEKDTTGCILVGLMAGMLGPNPAVKLSKDAMNLMRGLVGPNPFHLDIVDALVQGHTVW